MSVAVDQASVGADTCRDNGPEPCTLAHLAAFDLVTAPPCQFQAFLLGYQSGWLAGDARALEREHAQASALHRRAVAIVHAAAELPTHADLTATRKARTLAAASRWKRLASPDDWPIT